MFQVCNHTCADEDLLKELSAAAADVTKTLNDLLSHIKLATQVGKVKEYIQEDAVDAVMIATDKLFASTGNAEEMVHHARIVGQATAQLIQSVKGDAEKYIDVEQQRRLLEAARILADATAKMV